MNKKHYFFLSINYVYNFLRQVTEALLKSKASNSQLKMEILERDKANIKLLNQVQNLKEQLYQFEIA